MEQEMSNFTLHLKSSLVLNGISYFQSSFVCVVFCPYVYIVLSVLCFSASGYPFGIFKIKHVRSD